MQAYHVALFGGHVAWVLEFKVSSLWGGWIYKHNKNQVLNGIVRLWRHMTWKMVLTIWGRELEWRVGVVEEDIYGYRVKIKIGTIS